MTFRDVWGKHLLVGDGALGTELEARQRGHTSCLEELNLQEPETVQTVHRDYLTAGADWIETNTFGANAARLRLHGLDHRLSDLVTGGVRLAREVCPAGKFVAGSVGPTGEIPAPYGSLDLKTGVDLFAEPIRILAREGVDLILIETMMSLEEAEMAVRAAREVCSLPVCMSMTFEVREGRVHSAYGVTPEQWVQAAMDWQVAGVGANCGQGFAEMVTVLKAFPAGVPVFAQANAGLPVQQGTRWVYPDKPDTAKKWVEKLIALNPALIGGCCGTRPEHIRLIRTLVDAGDYDS